MQKVELINGVNFIGEIVNVPNADSLKKLGFSFKRKSKRFLIVFAADIDGKANVVIAIDEKLVASKNTGCDKNY